LTLSTEWKEKSEKTADASVQAPMWIM